MIVLITDFGLTGPYTGQLKAVLARQAPDVPVIDLFADAPCFSPKPTAYLLAAYCETFGAGTVFLTVVDPGVGSMRPAGLLRAGGRWYVGPGNGVFEMVIRRALNDGVQGNDCAWWPLDETASMASATFHGRDIFAPAAAGVATGSVPSGRPVDPEPTRQRDWPDDLAEVIYIDTYGNAMIGVRARMVDQSRDVRIRQQSIPFLRTFSDVAVGAPVCYENANGLLEVAVNQGHAAQLLGLDIGSRVNVAVL